MEVGLILNGKEVFKELPMHPCEIRFDEYCLFKEKESVFYKVNEDEEADPEDCIRAFVEMLEAIYKFDLWEIPQNIPGDDVNALIDEGYYLATSPKTSLTRLYAHLCTLVNNYRTNYIPKTFDLGNGHKFHIKKEHAKSMLLGIGYNTGQVVEIMEFQRRAAKLIEMSKEGTKAIDFNLGIREMCFLLLRKGEKIPHTRSKLRVWLARKTKILANMNMDDVLNVRFFLLNILKECVVQEITRSFSTVKKQIEPDSQQISEAKLIKLKNDGERLVGDFTTRLQLKRDGSGE